MKMKKVKQFCVVLITFGLLLSSSAYSAVNINATDETASPPGSKTGDIADDICIWVHPTDTSQSMVIGQSKDTSHGGIYVYDLDGTQLQAIDMGHRTGNIDIRYNFAMSTGATDVVVVNDREEDDLKIYRVNSNRTLTNINYSHPNVGVEPYGGCLYKDLSNGKLYYFVAAKDGTVRQFELTEYGSTGLIEYTLVRSVFDVGGQLEGAVADDENNLVYFGEEDEGVWRYDAKPDGSNTGTEIISVDTGELVEDVEGLSIYYTSDGGGYLLVSSQGNSKVIVYERTGSHTELGAFHVNNVSETDGLDVINMNLGGSYDEGLFVLHDGENDGSTPTNWKYVSWGDIADALNLTVDTTWNPRGTLIDFENFSTGSIDGQGGWDVEVTNAEVTTDSRYVISGNKSLIVYYGAGNAVVTKSFTGAALLEVEFDTGDCATNKNGRFRINDGSGNHAVQVNFTVEGKISAYNGSTKVDIMSYEDYDTNKRSYNFRIVADTGSQTYDFYIDDVRVADDYGFYESTGSQLSELSIKRYTSSKLIVDNLKITKLQDNAYETNFESFSTGSIDNQDGWEVITTNGIVTTDSAYVISGSKSLIVYYGAGNAEVTKSFTGGAAVNVEFDTGSCATDKNGRFRIEDGSGNLAAQVNFSTNGQISAYNGTTIVDLMAYEDYDTNNKSYNFYIIADAASQTYDFYIDDVRVANDFGFYESTGSLSEFSIKRYTSSKLIVDNLYISPI
ncbi:MAG: phytase [Anaerohalosphaeraceae bacterium]|nr:phytase [Anaerohalosphaeraceae bacterium]